MTFQALFVVALLAVAVYFVYARIKARKNRTTTPATNPGGRPGTDIDTELR